MGCTSSKPGVVDNAPAFAAPKKITTPSNRLEHNLARRSVVSDIAELFELQDFIGEGQFGAVNKAVMKKSGTACALKVIKKDGSPDDREQLDNEINVLRQLEHPNIVRLLQVVEDGTRIAIALELCTGSDLMAHLQTYPNHRMPEKKVQMIAAKLLSALAYMHSRSMMHRDIKVGQGEI
jgi:calcium-dependent protein kinase